MPTMITLIRHGETEWNRNSRWQGHTDVELNSTGVLQARALADRFSTEDTEFDVVYCSDLRRAAQTAEILCAALGLTPIPEKNLRELDVGKWSGLYDHEVAERYSDEWKRVRADEDIPRGGAENMAALSARVCRKFDSMASANQNKRICVVTHNGVIRAILLHIKKLPMSHSNDLGSINNCSLTVVRTINGNWVVDSVNDTAHLNGFTAPPDMLAL